MPCRPFSMQMSDGKTVTGFVCGGRRRAKCQEIGCYDEHTALCDFELAGAKAGKTCSRRMCEKHRREQSPAPDGSRRDFCIAHDKISKMPPAAQGTTTGWARDQRETGDEFIDAVKRGTAKLEQGAALPWWALVTAAAAMRASSEWTTVPLPDVQGDVCGEIEAR